MATDDQQVFVVGQADAPAGFLIPGNGQIKPKVARAVYDGTNAAGDFLPVLQVISDAGIIVGEYVGGKIAAGASASVSWFPEVGGQATTDTDVLPQAAWVGNLFGGTLSVVYPNQPTIRWDTFNTTDTGTFGTQLNSFTLPPSNTDGDRVLVCLRDGAYVAFAWTQWSTGAYDHFAQIQVLHGSPLTQNNGVSSTAETPTTVSPAFGSTGLTTFDTQMFYVDSNFTPGALEVLVGLSSTGTHTITAAAMAVFYLGGPGTDLVNVY